jgi:8-amino-7-oxononanoate synthase
MTASYQDWLRTGATERSRDGLDRRLYPRASGAGTIDLASNDYLGLATDPRLIEAATQALRTWGAGATGSRLVTGSTTLHADLEARLAAFGRASDALVFSSGYCANLGVVTALSGRGALVISDADNHASLVDSCRLSRSRVVVAPHGDLAAVEAALASRAEPRCLVVVDAVFSTDGSLAPLDDLHRLCRRYDALLVVDEAHSLGVIGPGGRGLAAAVGIEQSPDVIRTVTLSKALGSQGGAVLAGSAIIDHLINTARTFIFDTALAPASVAAARTALDVIEEEPKLIAELHDRRDLIAASLDVPPPSGAVTSLVLGDAELTARAAAHCRDHDVIVGCFRPPSVPAGQSRLRVTARASLTPADIDRATTVIVESVAASR